MPNPFLQVGKQYRLQRSSILRKIVNCFIHTEEDDDCPTRTLIVFEDDVGYRWEADGKPYWRGFVPVTAGYLQPIDEFETQHVELAPGEIRLQVGEAYEHSPSDATVRIVREWLVADPFDEANPTLFLGDNGWVYYKDGSTPLAPAHSRSALRFHLV